MDISKYIKVEQKKENIMKELFTDINSKNCILDAYLDVNGKNIYQISRYSKSFIEKNKMELLNEYNSGNILFFRKYNYEKILNQYLENKYKVIDLGMKMFTNEQNKQIIDEYKSKQIEKEKRKLREKSKKDIEEKNRREAEEKIIKDIPFLKWKKEVRISNIVYKAKDNENKNVELHYAIHNSNKIKDNKLIYDNKTFKYVGYDVNKIVEIIEKTNPSYVEPGHITYVINTENSERYNKKESGKKNNKQIEIKEVKPINYNICIASKEEVIENVEKKYNLRRSVKERCVDYYQNKCSFFNNNSIISCKLKGRKCSALSSDCPHNKELLRYIKQEKKRSQKFSKPKTLSEIADEYNTTIQNINSITGNFKSRCKYYRNNKCNYKGNISNECSLQSTTCLFNDEFLAAMKKHSEKNLRKKQSKNSAQIDNQNEKVGIKKNNFYEIGLKDFIVRGNVFKCMNKKHKIDNIVAMVKVDNDGKSKMVKISAGYCPECKVYFIMDSTYHELKKKGLILCRITDHKNYMKNSLIGGMNLAQESILMQYGYNVSQAEGLTATGRQKILAVIIDNKILSKSEIISYLDFFINQRSKMSNMGMAISKWEADREFVENYRIGHYTQYGINAIYRR